MRTSDFIPTAVDYTNILVNYVEVSADDIPIVTTAEERDHVPDGVYPPQVIPQRSPRDRAAEAAAAEQEVVETPNGFGKDIPACLIDVDTDNEDSDYNEAAGVISDTPAPPGLPLFLGKSILNGQTPIQDDNSVLNYPNHTVLNHLATSSIKNHVLATSGTTRYKSKV